VHRYDPDPMQHALTVAVTGASGFVGRAACARLRARGHDVRPVPRVNEPRGAEAVRALFHGADAVLHLAALAHRTGGDQPTEQEYMESNAEHAGRTAKLARECGVRRFVFMSSVAVYGAPDRMPVDEETPLLPITAYGRSKARGEALVVQALEAGGWVILRPPVVHGPGQPGNLARLAAVIDRGLPIPDFGPGIRRSIIALENLVDATMVALCDPRAAGRVWTIADGTAFTVRELGTIAAAARGRHARFVRIPVAALRAGRAIASALSAGGIPAGDRLAEDFRRLGTGFEVDGTRFMRQLDWTPPADPITAMRAAFAP